MITKKSTCMLGILLCFFLAYETAFAGVMKINDGLYIGQKEKDLYFAMERVDKWNVDFWQAYVQWQKEFRNKLPSDSKIKSTTYDGILGFQSYIESYNADKADHDLWVAYATPAVNIKNKALKNRRFFKIANYRDALATFEGLEMTFCVATSKDSPFVTHMGIGRGVAYMLRNHAPHKHIALDLHSFAAKVVKLTDARKRYMITTPTSAMREIFEGGLPNEALFLGDSSYEDYLHDAIAADSERLEVETNGPKRRALEDNIRMSTTALTAFQQHPSPIVTQDDRFVLYDHVNGKVLLDIDSMQDDYDWFFGKSVHRQRPPEYVWATVDLNHLAGVGKLVKH